MRTLPWILGGVALGIIAIVASGAADAATPAKPKPDEPQPPKPDEPKPAIPKPDAWGVGPGTYRVEVGVPLKIELADEAARLDTTLLKSSDMSLTIVPQGNRTPNRRWFVHVNAIANRPTEAEMKVDFYRGGGGSPRTATYNFTN